MARERQALELIGRIYDAAIEPGRWQDVAAGFSEALDRSPVALSLVLPGVPDSARYCTVGLGSGDDAGCHTASWGGLAKNSPLLACFFVREFVPAGRFFERPIAESRFYQRWMKPRGLAPIRPLVHIIAVEERRPIASIVVYRRKEAGEFSEDDVAFANLLVPHLSRAFEMCRVLGRVTRQRLALAEVMDRLPAGVILLNDRGRVVLTNRSADRILARRNGLVLEGDALSAADAPANLQLRELVAQVIAPGAQGRRDAGGVMAAPQTSGPRSYPISVSALPPGETVRDAVAAILVGDPESVPDPAAELLRNLHSLTPAEAELVGHLARGRSLEEAAQARGVSIHTARSQLKQVFAKTDTSRQGELIRLVLACVVPMVEE